MMTSNKESYQEWCEREEAKACKNKAVGRDAERKNIVKRLLEMNVSLSEISEITELSIKEIEDIRREGNNKNTESNYFDKFSNMSAKEYYRGWLTPKENSTNVDMITAAYEEKIKIAKRMLNGNESIEKISEYTELSIKEVENLKKEKDDNKNTENDYFNKLKNMSIQEYYRGWFTPEEDNAYVDRITGAYEASVGAAEKLLEKGMDIEEISEITKLSINEIEDLKKEK